MFFDPQRKMRERWQNIAFFNWMFLSVRLAIRTRLDDERTYTGRAAGKNVLPRITDENAFLSPNTMRSECRQHLVESARIRFVKLRIIAARHVYKLAED